MDKSEITRVFDQLGLKCYATPEAIDQKYRRLMLKVHPDKCTTDEESLKRAQDLNALRELAKQIARDPAHHAPRQEERAKDDPSTDKVRLLERMIPILQDHLDKARHESDPLSYAYLSIRLELASYEWTPKQRKDAEDAVRHGLERHHLDDALAEADALLLENARLRASQSQPRARANQDLDASEARLAYAVKRADDLMARADEGMQATAALQEVKARSAAAEAELAQADKALGYAKDDVKTWQTMFNNASAELAQSKQSCLHANRLCETNTGRVQELQAELDCLKQGNPHTLILPRINLDLEAELKIKTQLLAEVEDNYKRSFAEVEETHKQSLTDAERKADADRAQYSTTLADLETRLAAANAWEQRLLARTAEPDALRAQLQHANEALQRESDRVLQLEQQLKDVQQSDAAKSKKRKSRPASD
jgi:curved DNA-binding protein CbpA